jgi:hypothetical protein
MLKTLRTTAQRANAVRLATTALAGFGTNGTTATTAWNAMPSVHDNAICTHGKRYEWRLREMPT